MLLKKFINFILLSFSVNCNIYTNFQGKIECNASGPILHPASTEQLHEIVKSAIKEGKRVRIVGSGHSNNDNICTDGIPIQLKLIKEASYNETDGTATVSAGWEFLDALDRMDKFGVTIPVVPTYGGITVGAAAAMGVTGSSLQFPNVVSAYLKALTIIDGHGNLITIQDTDKDFEALRISLGQLGVIVSATFKTVPKQKMKVTHTKDSDKLLKRGPSEIVSRARKHLTYQLWWFPLSNSMVVHEGNAVPLETPGNAITHLIPNVAPILNEGTDYSFERFQAKNSTLLMHSAEIVTEARLHTYVPFQEPIFEDNGVFVNPAVGLGYKLQMNKCTDCGWDQAPLSDKRVVFDGMLAAINIKDFPDAVRDLDSIFNRFPVAFPAFGVFIRFGKSAPGVFSYGSNNDVVIFELMYPLRDDFLNKSPVQMQVLQSVMQLLIFKYKAKPHWSHGTAVFHNNDIISQRYDISKFHQAIERFDPNGVFRNKYGNRILGIGQPQYDVPSKPFRCALFGSCLCSKDSDCPDREKCGSLIGYPVCTSHKTWGFKSTNETAIDQESINETASDQE